MYKVACTRKEASCIIGNLLRELCPICERCQGLADDELALSTEGGLVIAGKELSAIEGRSVFTGEPVMVQFTEYGFELHGNLEEVQKIRKTRCLYGAVHTSKEG